MEVMAVDYIKFLKPEGKGRFAFVRQIHLPSRVLILAVQHLYPETDAEGYCAEVYVVQHNSQGINCCCSFAFESSEAAEESLDSLSKCQDFMA